MSNKYGREVKLTLLGPLNSQSLKYYLGLPSRYATWGSQKMTWREPNFVENNMVIIVSITTEFPNPDLRVFTGVEGIINIYDRFVLFARLVSLMEIDLSM